METIYTKVNAWLLIWANHMHMYSIVYIISSREVCLCTYCADTTIGTHFNLQCALLCVYVCILQICMTRADVVIDYIIFMH